MFLNKIFDDIQDAINIKDDINIKDCVQNSVGDHCSYDLYIFLYRTMKLGRSAKMGLALYSNCRILSNELNLKLFRCVSGISRLKLFLWRLVSLLL